MTSAYALRGVATKVLVFSLTAAIFVFIWVLVTGVHP